MLSAVLSCDVVLEKVVRGQKPHFGQKLVNFGTGALETHDTTKFEIQSVGLNPNTKIPELLITSKADNAKIKDGRAYVAAHGVIKYDDIFGISHWTKFCTYASDNMPAVQDFAKPCPDYNAVDNN